MRVLEFFGGEWNLDHTGRRWAWMEAWCYKTYTSLLCMLTIKVNIAIDNSHCIELNTVNRYHLVPYTIFLTPKAHSTYQNNEESTEPKEKLGATPTIYFRYFMATVQGITKSKYAWICLRVGQHFSPCPQIQANQIESSEFSRDKHHHCHPHINS